MYIIYLYTDTEEKIVLDVHSQDIPVYSIKSIVQKSVSHISLHKPCL